MTKEERQKNSDEIEALEKKLEDTQATEDLLNEIADLRHQAHMSITDNI
jgi:hypothetical protein